jgi:hypothetical protein
LHHKAGENLHDKGTRILDNHGNDQSFSVVPAVVVVFRIRPENCQTASSEFTFMRLRKISKSDH